LFANFVLIACSCERIDIFFANIPYIYIVKNEYMEKWNML